MENQEDNIIDTEDLKELSPEELVDIKMEIEEMLLDVEESIKHCNEIIKRN